MYIHITSLVEAYLDHLEDEEVAVSETDKQLRVARRRVHALQQTFQSLRGGSNARVIHFASTYLIRHKCTCRQYIIVTSRSKNTRKMKVYCVIVYV